MVGHDYIKVLRNNKMNAEIEEHINKENSLDSIHFLDST
jgi:hypothetical protein